MDGTAGPQIFSRCIRAVIAAPSLIQTVVELRQDERPRVLDVFRQPPTAANLHAYEKELSRPAS